MARIAHLDPQSRTLLFSGVGREPGRDPYFVHYYKASLDGGLVQLLTPEDANHEARFSKDGRYFLDIHSTVDTAPVAVLRDRQGASVAQVAHADL